MKKSSFVVYVLLPLLGILTLPLTAGADLVRTCPEGFNDTPVIGVHVEQADIDSGTISFEEIVDFGEAGECTIPGELVGVLVAEPEKLHRAALRVFLFVLRFDDGRNEDSLLFALGPAAANLIS